MTENVVLCVLKKTTFTDECATIKPKNGLILRG